MKFSQLFGYYFLWHYGRAFSDLLGVIRNFFWFFYNFFSIGALLKTLFSPLMRLQERYAGDFNLGEYISVIAVNILMRVVGLVMRIFVIGIGVVTLLVVSVASLLISFFWLFLPALVPIFFFWGVILLII